MAGPVRSVLVTDSDTQKKSVAVSRFQSMVRRLSDFAFAGCSYRAHDRGTCSRERGPQDRALGGMHVRFAAQRFSSAKRGLSVAWVVLLAVMLVAGHALAQGTGVLIGTVLDTATKRPVADVVVTVTSPALQGEQIVVTDGSGLYRIPNLPPGNYTLRLDKETYRPFQRGGITLRAEATIRVNAELLPESVQQGEEIVVTGSAPTVDVGSTTTGAHITSDFTSRIPVSIPTGKGGATRSFESVAEVTPGAHSDGYGVSISGTTSPENQYVIDGLSVNNTAYGVNGTGLSIEFVKETNVISGGYLPEYGRATGGILDVVTKSGSNEFHGSIFGSFTPGALEGERDKVLRVGQTINTDGELKSIRDFGFDIGGPIIKDKLWFYGGMQVGISSYSAERYLSRIVLDANNGNALVTDENGNPTVEEIQGTRRKYDVEQRTLQYIGKLSWAVNQDNQLTLSVFGAPSFSGGRGNFGILPNSGALEANDTNNINGNYGAIAHIYDSISNDVVLKYSSAFKNKKWLLDVTLGWHHEDATGPFGESADGSEIGSNQGLSGIPNTVWGRSVNAEFGYPSPHTITDFRGEDPNLAAGCVDPTIDMGDAGTDTDGDFVADDFDPEDDGVGGPDGLPDKPAGNSKAGTLCPVFSYGGGGSGFISRASLNRYQGKAVVTSIFEGLGHHVAKVGLDLEFMGYKVRKAYSGGKQYSESPDGTFFDEARQLGFLQGPDDPVVQPYIDSDNSSTTIGGFVQDSWSIMDKVTLNIGVRYDAQMLYNDAGKLGMVVPHQVSPRAGLIWDPTQQGKSKIYASFARYHENVPLNIADRALTGDFQIRSRRTAGTGGDANCDPQEVPPDADCTNPATERDFGSSINPNRRWRNVGAGRTPVDEDLKPQASDEISVGAEFEVFADARLGASWTHRYMVNVIEDMSVDEAATYFIGNPGSGIASSFPEAERDYDAVTLYLYKTFKNQWLAQASYTVSYLRGNYAGLFRPETTQLDPNSNADFDLVVLTQNRYGSLPGDRTHELKIFGAKDFDLGKRMVLQLGLRANARSGEPTSVLGSEDVIGYGTDEVFILERGSGERLPWIFSVDPHVGWQFELGKESALTLYMDVFNVFNFQGVTRVDETYTGSGVFAIDGADSLDRLGELRSSATGEAITQAELNPNFGRPTQYQSPRTFRFGGKVTF